MINPTPSYPNGYDKNTYLGRKWESKAECVTKLKKKLKDDLRNIQVARCCYCRRHLGDIQDTHLEHFIEKSAFPDLTFSIKNLSLSCSTCNTMKNSCFRRLSTKESMRQSRLAGVIVKAYRCPVLTKSTLSSLSDANEYRWFNPHLEPFSDHIVIRKNWIFLAKTAKGRRVTKSLKLNALKNVELRAASERLAAKKGTLAFTVGLISEASHFNGSALAQIASTEIRRRRALVRNMGE